MNAPIERAVFVFAAGGTGGHIFPALAVADALKRIRPDAEIHFVGSGKPIEQEIVGRSGYPLHTVHYVPFKGKGLLGMLRLVLKTPLALLAGVKLLRELRPAAVLGFGGYPSFIPFVSAYLLGLPRMLHEQNAQVGLANKILARLAKLIIVPPGAVGLEAYTAPRLIELMLPVRSVFDSVPTWSGPAPGSGATILITGGSQGAMSLNQAVVELIPLWRAFSVSLIHLTGAADYQRVKEAYQGAEFSAAEVYEFSNDIAALYARSHLVIGRAGAGTVAEVSASGRPALYVPLEISSAHQVRNTKHVVAAGAALVVRQTPNLAGDLQAALTPLLEDPARLEQMAERARSVSGLSGSPAAAVVAEHLLVLAGQRRSAAGEN